MSEKKRIIRNTLANGAAQFSQMIASFVLLPFLIDSFGAAHYGLFLLASSVVGYAALLDLGVGTSLQKLVAERAARDERHETGDLVASALSFYITIGVVALALLIAFAFAAPAVFRLRPADVHLMRNLFLAAGAVSLFTWPLSLGASVLAGLQRHDLAARVAVGATFANIVVTVAIIARGEGPLFLLLGQGLVTIIAGLVNCWLAFKMLREHHVLLGRPNRTTLRAIFAFSWTIFVFQIAVMVVMQQTDRLVLGVFVGAVAVTLYEAAGKFQGFIGQLVAFANSAVLPLASELDAANRAEMLRGLYVRGTKYTLALISPVVLCLIVLARPLLEVWLGRQLGSSLPIVALSAQILVAPQLLVAGTTIGHTMTVGMGRLPKRLPYYLAMAAENLALSVFLVQRIGMLGVVIGTAVPYLIDYPLHVRFLLGQIDVPFGRWMRGVVLPIYPLLIVPAAICVGAMTLGLTNGLASLALVAAVAVGAYWALLYSFSLSARERDDVRTFGRLAMDRVRRQRAAS